MINRIKQIEINNLDKNITDFEENRLNALNILYKYRDDKASERIVDIIRNKKYK